MSLDGRCCVNADQVIVTHICFMDLTGCISSVLKSRPRDCGDGKNIDPEECDDGNGNDGDGCSSTCVIEPNFDCTPGCDNSCINYNNCTKGCTHDTASVCVCESGCVWGV